MPCMGIPKVSHFTLLIPESIRRRSFFNAENAKDAEFRGADISSSKLRVLSAYLCDDLQHIDGVKRMTLVMSLQDNSLGALIPRGSLALRAAVGPGLGVGLSLRDTIF